jgi:hypothetical protein
MSSLKRAPLLLVGRGSFLVSPTFPLRVPDSLSGSGTHLPFLRNNMRSRLLSSITGQQSTGLLQACNFDVN